MLRIFLWMRSYDDLSSPGLRICGGRERFHFAVSDTSLFVEEPAPFVEVAEHAGDVDAQHACAVARCGGV